MKRRRCGRLVGMIAGLMLTVAAVSMSGCGSRYEAIVIESQGAEETAVRPSQTMATAVEGPSQTMTVAAEGPVQTMAAENSQNIAGYLDESEATISENDVPLSTEKAIVMTPVDQVVYVTGEEVNLRAKASMSGQVLGQLDSGAELRRTGYHEIWSQVEYQGLKCFISSQYVSLEKPASEPESAETLVGDEQRETVTEGKTEQREQVSSGGQILLDSSWKYAEFSKINTGAAVLYRSESANRRNITICVNAGHGTSGGSGVKTLCHPDGTPKVTGGTTGAGATTAVAVSGGMTFSDGTAEAKVTLAMAKILKEKLLVAGYDVLMIRESDDAQLDNIARTVIANNRADCHIALHWDSTTSDKGAFYMSVPNVESYRNMEPVKSNWQKHNALGESLVAGLKDVGVKIFSGGAMEMDLTQTSYSTVPSVDIELGDKASDHSEAALKVLAEGLLNGVNRYFGQ